MLSFTVKILQVKIFGIQFKLDNLNSGLSLKYPNNLEIT